MAKAGGKSLWKKASASTVVSSDKKKPSLLRKLSFSLRRKSATSAEIENKKPLENGASAQPTHRSEVPDVTTGPPSSAVASPSSGAPSEAPSAPTSALMTANDDAPGAQQQADDSPPEGIVSPGSASSAAAPSPVASGNLVSPFLPDSNESNAAAAPPAVPPINLPGAVPSEITEAGAEPKTPAATPKCDDGLSFAGAVQAVVAAQDALDQVDKLSPQGPKRTLGRLEAERKRLIELELEQKEERKQKIFESRQTTLSVHKVLEAPKMFVHFDWVLKGAMGLYLVFCALVIKLFHPSLFWMCVTTVLFLPVGIALNFLFIDNSNGKQETRDQVHFEPGRHGMAELMHHVPSWIHYQEKEKVEWLNKILAKAWPYYDKAICNTIKEEVGPMIALYKPSFIANIGFEKLTFGDSPFRVDNIWVDREAEGQLVMEIAFRWQGDANISLGIELAGLAVAGDATKMVVKLTKLQLSGVLRIAMTPFVDAIPGFGAMTASLTKSPIIKYNLDFGKALGSSFSANLVRSWLDPFIKNTLVELLVWPERIVAPMMPESVTGNLDYLQKNNVGILEVTVVDATGLKAMDVGKNATSDPFVTLWSNPNRKMETKVIKKSLSPEWKETFHVLVQEPTTQDLKLEMYDFDGISLKELVGSINVVDNLRNATGGRQLMGRCIVPVKPYALVPGREVEDVFDLGRQDWSSIGGPGKGEGKLKLRFCYHPMSACRGLGFKTGAVMVHVLKLHGLHQLGIVRPMPLYVKVKLRDAKQKKYSKDVTMLPPRVDRKTGKSVVVDPEWNQLLDFYEIGKNDILEIALRERDAASDEEQGSLIISLDDLVIAKEQSTITQWFELENTLLRPGKKAKIQLKIEWYGFIPEDDVWFEAQQKAEAQREAAKALTPPHRQRYNSRKTPRGSVKMSALAPAPVSCGRASVFSARKPPSEAGPDDLRRSQTQPPGSIGKAPSIGKPPSSKGRTSNMSTTSALSGQPRMPARATSAPLRSSAPAMRYKPESSDLSPGASSSADQNSNASAAAIDDGATSAPATAKNTASAGADALTTDQSLVSDAPEDSTLEESTMSNTKSSMMAEDTEINNSMTSPSQDVPAPQPSDSPVTVTITQMKLAQKAISGRLADSGSSLQPASASKLDANPLYDVSREASPSPAGAAFRNGPSAIQA